MKKHFKHPLARSATTAKMRQRDGGEHELLIIVTTLELDADAKGFNPSHIDRLQKAAQAFLGEDEKIAGYAIVNRPKDWDR